MEKLVSIIVPIYNVENYLDACITSIVEQTYENIEIILVDDGSPDNSSKIYEEWKKKDNRIKIIKKQNGGLSDARNVGLKAAKGDLILFVDSDDFLNIDAVEKSVKVMDKHKADVVVFEFAELYPDGKIIKRGNYQQSSLEIYNRKEFFSRLLEDKSITNHVWRKLFKKDLIPSAPFPKGKNFEDIFSMPELIKNAKKIVSINDIEYFYRQNDEGIVKDLNLKNCQDFFEASLYATERISNLEPSLKEKAHTYQVMKDLTNLENMSTLSKSDSKLNSLRRRIKNNLKSYKVDNKYINGGKLKRLYFSLKKSTPELAALGITRNISRKPIKKIQQIYKNGQYTKQLKARIANKNKKKFVLLATPNYGNLGDQALKFGEIKFVNEYFKEYEIVDIPLDKLSISLSILKKELTNKDIVGLQAGGNSGTLYPGIHQSQLNALEYLKDKKIIIFPQTFYFENDENGKKVLKETYNIYKNIDKFIIFVRDKASFDYLKKKMPNLNILLVPDMALNLNVSVKSKKRMGALLLLRRDSEKTLSLSKEVELIKVIKKNYTQVKRLDTHIYEEDISSKYALEELKKLLKQYANSELIVTDRLHGMIFAVLTDTPCIVLKSKSKKIEGVYNWLKDNSYIRLVDNTMDVKKNIEELKSLKRQTFDRKSLDEKFLAMANEIKKL